MSEVTLEFLAEQNKKILDELRKSREWQTLADDRFKSIEHHSAGTYYATKGQTDEISLLRKRLARIEDRLELTDKPEH